MPIPPVPPVWRDPNGQLRKGTWLAKDWEQDHITPTPGFRWYADAVYMESKDPESRFLFPITTLFAQCHKMCNRPEVGDSHDVEKSFSVTTGWSVSGSGANISYSRGKEVQETLTLSHSFPHGSAPGMVTHWSNTVWQRQDSHNGYVVRYYENRGEVDSGRSVVLGPVVYKVEGPTLTDNVSKDQRCSEYQLNVPGPSSPETAGKVFPKNIQLLEMRELRLAVEQQSKKVQLDAAAKRALLAVLLNDQQSIAEIQGLVRRGIGHELTLEILSQRSWLETLSAEKKHVVAESFLLK